MAEGLGVAASAIEVANLGFKLSTSLYSYIETVASADRRLGEVATKIELTTAVIQEVGLIFDGPEIVALRKESAVTTAKNTLRECSIVFEEIEDAVVKSRKNKFTFPFRTSKLSALSMSLESLKSNLSLLLHVLQHAHRIASDEKARKETEDRIRERDEALKELQKQLSAEKDASKFLPPYDAGQVGGIFIGLHQQFPNQTEMDPPQNVSNVVDWNGGPDKIPAVPDTKSQVTAEELESCVSGLKKLIEHIECFQKSISVVAPTTRNALLDTYAEVRQTLEEVIPRCGPPKEEMQTLQTATRSEAYRLTVIDQAFEPSKPQCGSPEMMWPKSRSVETVASKETLSKERTQIGIGLGSQRPHSTNAGLLEPLHDTLPATVKIPAASKTPSDTTKNKEKEEREAQRKAEKKQYIEQQQAVKVAKAEEERRKADEERAEKAAAVLGSAHDTVRYVDEELLDFSLGGGYPATLAFSAPVSRGKYQFEADSEEEDMDFDSLGDTDAATRLPELGRAMGGKSGEWPEGIQRISQKNDHVDDQLALNRARLKGLDGYSPVVSTSKQKVEFPTEPDSQRAVDAVDELLKEWTNVYDL